MNIQETIKNFFSDDQITPHHFFTLESNYLTPAIIRETLIDCDVDYFFDRHYDNLGVADARTLIDLQSKKTNKKNIYIIAFSVITNEAQNALLKSLEEPGENKFFIFIVPQLSVLLPAFLSRTYVMRDKQQIEKKLEKFNITEFIEMTLEERFIYIKKITDKKLKTENRFSKKDLLDVLLNFEIFFHKSKNHLMLRKIIASREYAHTKGVSLKMILDDIAMSIELLHKK